MASFAKGSIDPYSLFELEREMFAFFRRHQKWLLLTITAIIILSFVFFGTFSTLLGEPVGDAPTQIDSTHTGDPIWKHDVHGLIDRLSNHPDWIQKNFIDTKALNAMADTIASEWASELRPKVERAQNRPLYEHPHHSFISAKQVYQLFAPHVISALDEVKDSNLSTDKEVIEAQLKLFTASNSLPENLLKQILHYQELQAPDAKSDPSLAGKDLSLSGCRTVQDWLGTAGVRLVAKTIICGAQIASNQGLKAPSTLQSPDQKLYLFEQLMAKWRQEALKDPTIAEKLAQAKDEIISVDINLYSLKPEFSFNNAKALSRFLAYEKDLKAKDPDLLRTVYSVRMCQLSKKDLLASIPMKDVWQWQSSDAHWPQVLLAFGELGAKNPKTQQERQEALDNLAPAQRKVVDLFCREKMAAEWAPTILEQMPVQRVDLVFGLDAPLQGLKDPFALKAAFDNKDPSLDRLFTQDDAIFYRFELESLTTTQEITPWNQAPVGLEGVSIPDAVKSETLACAARHGKTPAANESIDDFCARYYFLPVIEKAQKGEISDYLQATHLTMTEGDIYFDLKTGASSQIFFGSATEAHGYFFTVEKRNTLSAEEQSKLKEELCGTYSGTKLITTIMGVTP